MIRKLIIYCIAHYTEIEGLFIGHDTSNRLKVYWRQPHLIRDPIPPSDTLIEFIYELKNSRTIRLLRRNRLSIKCVSY